MSRRPHTPRHLKDLTPDPENRRRHTPRNLGMIVDALHQVGAARSIVIDENGQVFGGQWGGGRGRRGGPASRAGGGRGWRDPGGGAPPRG